MVMGYKIDGETRNSLMQSLLLERSEEIGDRLAAGSRSSVRSSQTWWVRRDDDEDLEDEDLEDEDDEDEEFEDDEFDDEELDDDELEEARWVTREELRDLFEKRSRAFFVPPPMSLANPLIRGFAYDD